MKKYLTLKNLMVVCAFVLTTVAFILSFSVNVTYNAGGFGVKTVYSNVVWGGGKTITDVQVPALTIVIIGAILVFISGLAACLFAFLNEKVDKKLAKVMALCFACLVVLGGVLFFLTKGSFATSLSSVSNVTKEDILKYSTGYGPATVGGILALVGGFALCGAEFVPDIKLVK